MTFVCQLKFKDSTGGYNDTIDFTTAGLNNKPRGGLKWSRNINKNGIYVPLPVGADMGSETPLIEGGYGYDLGFLQDNFVIEFKDTSYDNYKQIVTLIKSNNGEVPAHLVIGHSEGTTSSPETYNVMIRYCNFVGEPGGDLITYSITMTVVSTVYNS